MTQAVTNVLIRTLRETGYSVATHFERSERFDQEPAAVVNVTSQETGERWIVRAETEYDAVVQAFRQIGFDLEE